MKRTRLRRWRKRGKFGVFTDAEGRRTRTVGGVMYHSQMEAAYAVTLAMRQKATSRLDRIRSWRRQVPVKLEVNGRLVTTYIVDFVITHMDGHLEWIEVKGLETPEWRIKAALFRALFPDRQFTIVRNVRT